MAWMKCPTRWQDICRSLSKLLPQPLRLTGTIETRTISRTLIATFALAFWFCTSILSAQVNGQGERPYLGWSSYSEQTINGGFLTQANIQAESDALRNSGLQEHGFVYINIDSGWQGSFDAYGRPISNPTTFPDIQALIEHIHANGQKVGIYWIPGIEQPAVTANDPIYGTAYHTQDIVVTPLARGNAFADAPPNPYHDKIDFSKPGAQAYINSVVDLFASWGIDLIKLDGVTPGSDVDDLSIDNRPDVEAWSKAIAQSGRPMWLTISWDLDQDYLSTWQQYANARRIDQDVECEGNCATLTDWPRIAVRFYDLVGWEHSAGPSLGWNDLDSLDVGDGAIDGLTYSEKQTAITLWAMANAPIYLGGDLTQLGNFAKQSLSNDEVLAVDQSGHPAVQVTGGTEQVWASSIGNDSKYVALFNFNAFPSPVGVKWSDLGFASVVGIRNLWAHTNLHPTPLGYATVLPGHGTVLLKVTGRGRAPKVPSQSYEAEEATLSGTAEVSSCSTCSGGSDVGYIGPGIGTNEVTFNNVRVHQAGVYRMEVDYATQTPRAFVVTVNGEPSFTMNLGGGSFSLPESTTVPVQLKSGVNVITFSNPATYAPNLDRIVISGNGDAVPTNSTTYEAEAAILSGTASISGCTYCSGGGEAGDLGGGEDNSVTFTHVIVPQTATYQMEIDYLTDGPRSYDISVNDQAATELTLNGSSFSSPTDTIVPVQLHTGVNTISFTNPTGYAPALDCITISRWPEPSRP